MVLYSWQETTEVDGAPCEDVFFEGFDCQGRLFPTERADCLMSATAAASIVDPDRTTAFEWVGAIEDSEYSSRRI